MIIKLLFFSIIIYLIYRSVQNMMRAIRRDVREGMRPSMPRQERPTSPGWEARERSQVPRVTHDIEDAKWKDLPS